MNVGQPQGTVPGGRKERGEKSQEKEKPNEKLPQYGIN